MKIFENRSSAMAQSLQNNDNNAGIIVALRNNYLVEYPSELKIGTQVHDKVTLAPIFGAHHNYYGNGHSAFIMHNSRTTPKDLGETNGNISDYHPSWGNETASNFGNGQVRMSGRTHSKIWQSIYEPDKVYVCGLSYDYNHAYSYHYIYSNSQKKIITHARTDSWMNNVEWFHETASELYGVANSNYQYSGYPCIVRMTKVDLRVARSGHHHRTGYIHPLWWNDDYLYCQHSYGNWSSGRGAIAFDKFDFKGVDWTGTTYYWRDDYPTISHKAYIGLSLHKADGTAAKSFLYHSNVMTDGLANSVNTNDCWSSHPGFVYNSTLLDTHKIIRVYNVTRQAGGDWRIFRTNLPYHEHATAFTDDSGNAGGKAMGTSLHPRHDTRKCTITGIGSLPSVINDADTIGQGGTYYAGNTSHLYKHNNLTFFEAGGKGYLLWDHAAGNNNAAGVWTAAHLFRIKNYATSITATPNETDSLELEFIQNIEFGYNCWALYRPEDHAKTFVAMNRAGAEHKIYTFNETQEQFKTSSSLNGNYLNIGNTAEGDIYAMVAEDNNRHSIESLSLALPYKLEVTPSSERLEYTGTPLTPTVTVNAFNHQGTRVSISVNLQVIGQGATFTSSSATNGGKNLSVTTSAGADTTVNLELADPSLVRITAAMTI